MLSSRRSTREPSASRAISKPPPPRLRSSSTSAVSADDPAGQSHWAGSSTSMASTSAAPRRSISKAQKPSNVPTSRQRAPASEAGSGSVRAVSRRSNQPGVTTPGASSSVWYHWRATTRSRRFEVVGVPGTSGIMARQMSAAATATPPREPGAVPTAPAPPRARDQDGGRAGLALLVALLAACAYAVFAHGAVQLGDEAPLQAAVAVLGTVAGVLALGGGPLSVRAAPLAWLAAALLAAFAAWCAITLAWSLAPDASWQAADRALTYAVIVALALIAGTSARRAGERAAAGLLVIAVAVALWALLGKVFPGIVDGTALSPRLRDPLGYWNALALVCVMGAPMAIRLAVDVARRPAVRAAGLAALWLLVVVAALTYSRGAALALAAAVGVLLALGDRRLPALGVLALGALG